MLDKAVVTPYGAVDAALRIVMLTHLVLKAWRTVLWVALIAVLIGAAGATVRLLPWLVAGDVPGAVSLAFFETLVLASAEVGLVIALPVGCGIEVVRWGHDGVGATLRTLGVRPLRQASHVASVALVLGALTVAVSFRSAAVAASPGHLSNALLEAAGDEACASGRALRVPLVQAVWLCSQGVPRLVGWLPPRGPPSVAWTASRARFTSSLDRIDLDHVTWVNGPSTVIRARHVVITGFLPWLVPASVSSSLRAVASGLSACLAALATAWALLRWPTPSRARALLVAAAGTLGFLLFGGFLLHHLGWSGLPHVALLAAGGPLALAWATRFPWLPATGPGGTKHPAGNSATGTRVHG
ncbi:MAG: hypothetical protein CVU63_05710 [Deltaproteobacteria bacterium HGW-Deltaproteobacteria-20]|nr:MAG: hypothetical protein CVU63_05710 [Deltaproteobacteria bacterium HGW-Deltaproteobacteria-20]